MNKEKNTNRIYGTSRQKNNNVITNTYKNSFSRSYKNYSDVRQANPIDHCSENNDIHFNNSNKYDELKTQTVNFDKKNNSQNVKNGSRNGQQENTQKNTNYPDRLRRKEEKPRTVIDEDRMDIPWFRPTSYGYKPGSNVDTKFHPKKRTNQKIKNKPKIVDIPDRGEKQEKGQMRQKPFYPNEFKRDRDKNSRINNRNRTKPISRDLSYKQNEVEHNMSQMHISKSNYDTTASMNFNSASGSRDSRFSSEIFPVHNESHAQKMSLGDKHNKHSEISIDSNVYTQKNVPYQNVFYEGPAQYITNGQNYPMEYMRKPRYDTSNKMINMPQSMLQNDQRMHRIPHNLPITSHFENVAFRHPYLSNYVVPDISHRPNMDNNYTHTESNVNKPIDFKIGEIESSVNSSKISENLRKIMYDPVENETIQPVNNDVKQDYTVSNYQDFGSNQAKAREEANSDDSKNWLFENSRNNKKFREILYDSELKISDSVEENRRNSFASSDNSKGKTSESASVRSNAVVHTNSNSSITKINEESNIKFNHQKNEFQVKKRYSPIVEAKTFNEISVDIAKFNTTETCLRQFLTIDNWTDDVWNSIVEARTKFLSIGRVMMINHIEYSNSSKCDQTVWQYSYHCIIEKFIKSKKDPEKVTEIVANGLDFYKTLITDLEAKHNFNVAEIINNSQIDGKMYPSMKLAIILIQQFFIYIGDLYRYSMKDSECLDLAESHYLRAMAIDGRNALPYRRMSIVSTMKKKVFDIIYYEIRVLSLKANSLSNEEYVKVLFCNIFNRTSEIDKIKQHRLDQINKIDMNETRTRKEIWTRKDGTADTKIGFEDDIDDMYKISTNELFYKFTLAFLNAHGRLHDKIEMHSFYKIKSEALSSFDSLLHSTEESIFNLTHEYLYKHLIFNVYSIHISYDRYTSEAVSSPKLVEQSVKFGLDFFSIICKHLHESLTNSAWLAKNNDILLSAIHIWAQWMDCHTEIWKSVKLPRKKETEFHVDTWTNICDLLNDIKQFSDDTTKFTSRRENSKKLILIPEEMFFNGFSPLSSFKRKTIYIDNDAKNPIALLHYRILSLKYFSKMVSEMENSPIYLDDDKYCPAKEVEPKTNPLTEKVSKNYNQTHIDPKPVPIKSVWNTNPSSEIVSLKKKKALLKSELAKKSLEKPDNIDEFNMMSGLTKIEIRITPEVLIPDTNCFISFLGEIKTLVWRRRFSVVIPFIVFNELEMLASGKRAKNYALEEHALFVQNSAIQSVKFIEDEIETGNPSLRLIDIKGDSIADIKSNHEEVKNKHSNDDLILKCTLSFVKDSASTYIKKMKGAPIRLNRECVLLTDDRNLRLRAHILNIPVKTLPEFLKWADISKV
ncbi:hypothetical protein A3Q56_03022 [Intoshia linei]|uniref:PIN domain-containing protein n=1 Tax=Intoshia linei TaxID=1819745 RepID=A0A177B4S7_9BILA|nr:hypothetical protein A3Q56_03022 [Intoshia linei]